MPSVGYYDCETTGSDVTKDRIIEVALVIKDNHGNTLRTYEQRINPQMKISSGALEVHGIADADVALSPTFEQVAPILGALLEECDLVVAHNGDGFDWPITLAEFKRVGAKVELPPQFDTMLTGRGCTPDGKVPTLGELCWALDVDYDPALAHAALYDVERMAAAFEKGVDYGVFG